MIRSINYAKKSGNQESLANNIKTIHVFTVS